MTQEFYWTYKNMVRDRQGARGRLMREGEIVDMLFDESDMSLPSCKSMARRIRQDLTSDVMALGVEIDKITRSTYIE